MYLLLQIGLDTASKSLQQFPEFRQVAPQQQPDGATPPQRPLQEAENHNLQNSILNHKINQINQIMKI